MNNFLSPNINFQSLSAQSLTAVISNAKLDENFKIDWSTSSLSGFVFFGSAYSITQLAINKILQTYPINSLSSVSASSSDFEMAQKYYYSYSQFEQQIFNGFSLSLTGIYNNDTFTIKNIPRNIDNTVIELNDQIYINGLLSDAQIYDSQNKNMLQNFIPDKFLEYDDNGIFTGLLNIWGQTFDQILLYTSQFSNNLFNTDYINLNRAIDDYNTLNLLGMNVYTNYLFSSLLDFLIVTDNKVSYKAIQENVWNRILNNLIYIYKSKGTLESIKAFINCIGLNMDLIKIHEYVNFTTPQYVNTIKNINYFELNFGSSASTYISATSNAFNLNLTEWSIICNLNLKGINKTQNLFGVPNQYNLALVDSSTFDDYGQPILAGYISFTGYLANGTTMILTSSTGNIWSYDPQTLIVQRTLSGYELYLNKIDLYYNGSQTPGSNIELDAITSMATGYYDFGLYDVNLYDMSLSSFPVFYLGNNGAFNNTYSGSIINLKIFNTSLNANQIDDFSTNLSRLNLIKENLNNNVLVNWLFDEPLYLAYINNNYQYSSITGVNPERIILDSSTGFINGTATGFSYFPNGNYYTTDTLDYPTQRFVSGLTRYSDKINIDGNNSYINTKYLDIEIKPIDILNESFEYIMGAIDVIDYLSRDDFNTNYNKYLELDKLKNIFYSTSINLDGFFNLIDNIDKYGVGLFQIIYQFLPANSTILYKGVVIESPIYDRNKYIIRNLELTNLSKLEDIIQSQSILSKSISSINDNINIVHESAEIIDSISSNNVDPIYSITGNSDIVYNIPIDINLLSPYENKKYDTNDSVSGMDSNINYIYNLDNIVNSYSLDNQLITPVTSFISSAYGRLITSGYKNIYLNYSFSGESLYNIGYFDLFGDNIIGTKYTIYQNIGNNFPAFNIINLDNGITSNSLMQTFYINNYNGNNVIFNFNPSYGSITSVKNKIIINDYQEQEIDFNIIWHPDSRTVYNNYLIKDDSILHTYPVLFWNLNTGISAVSAVHSNYGSSITSSTLTTSADIYFTTTASLTSINIVFKNYSPDTDDELNMWYYTSLTSPYMSLYKLKDSSNNILYKSSLDNYSLIKTKVYKNSSVAFSLIMDYASNIITTFGNESIVNGNFYNNFTGWSISGSSITSGYRALYISTEPPQRSNIGIHSLICSTTAIVYQIISVLPSTNYTLSFFDAMGGAVTPIDGIGSLVVSQTISNINTLSSTLTSSYIYYDFPYNYNLFSNNTFNIVTTSTANYITIAFLFNASGNGTNYARINNVSIKPYNYLPAASGYIKFLTSTDKTFQINFSNNGI